jgi:hypothetical protein
LSEDIKTLSEGLEVIRERPAMFLTPVSTTALRNFKDGYSQGLSHGLSLGSGPLASEARGLYDLPSDFHDWVAYRLHFEYSGAGWANMIIERIGDGPEALGQFFDCWTNI